MGDLRIFSVCILVFVGENVRIEIDSQAQQYKHSNGYKVRDREYHNLPHAHSQHYLWRRPFHDLRFISSLHRLQRELSLGEVKLCVVADQCRCAHVPVIVGGELHAEGAHTRRVLHTVYLCEHGSQVILRHDLDPFAVHE